MMDSKEAFIRFAFHITENQREFFERKTIADRTIAHPIVQFTEVVPIQVDSFKTLQPMTFGK